jgi:PAS domain S-box-containing protein
MNKPRILIVADRAGAGDFLEGWLRTRHFQWIGTATSIQEALLLADSASPDLAILDFVLPDAPDGIQTAALLQARFGIPVLHLADEAHADVFEQAQTGLSGDYLTKPFSDRELARALEYALDRHELLRRLKASEAHLAETRAIAENYRQQLSQSEHHVLERVPERFRIALDSSPDAIFLIDPATMRFLDFNQTACDSLEYTRAELIVLEPHDIQPEFDKTRLHERFVETFAGKPGADLIQTLHQRKDGARFPVEVRLRPFESEGRPLVVAVARDISERLLAETLLKEASERFTQIAENIQEVFWIRDIEENRFLYINPAFESMFRMPVGNVLQNPRSFLDRVHPDDQPRVAAAFEWQNRNRQGVDLEYRIIVRDNELRWIWVRTFPVLDSLGKVYRMAGIAEDVTHRRESEEQYRTIIQASIDGFWVADA